MMVFGWSPAVGPSRASAQPGSWRDAQSAHEALDTGEFHFPEAARRMNLFYVPGRDLGAHRIWNIFSPRPQASSRKSDVPGWVVGVHDVAVGVVLPLITYRILPIVEHLAAKHMSTNTPMVRPASHPQKLITLTYRVQVERLERDMQEFRARSAEQRDRVMIGRLRPAIETKETERGASIRQTLHVARDDPKVTHVPLGRAIEIRALQYDMTDFEYRTWCKSAAHCNIGPRLVMRRVDGR